MPADPTMALRTLEDQTTELGWRQERVQELVALNNPPRASGMITEWMIDASGVWRRTRPWHVA